MNANATTDRSHHGAFEANGLVNANAYHDMVDYSRTTWLGDKNLVKITRLRMITDRDFPMWDVSYCHGVLKDGTTVPVNLPVTQFRKGRIKADIIAMAKQAGVFAKGLGLLDEFSVWSQVHP